MQNWFRPAGDLPENNKVVNDGNKNKKTFGLTMPTNDDLGYSENIIAMPTTLDEKRDWLSGLMEKGKKFDKKTGYVLDSGSLIFMFDELWKMIIDEKDPEVVYVIESFELFDNAPFVNVYFSKYTTNKELVDKKRRSGF